MNDKTHVSEDLALTADGKDLDDPRVTAAVEAYQAALEAGQPIDRAQFLAEHAEIAEALAPCLGGLEFLHAASPHIQSTLPEHSPLSSPTAMLGDFRIKQEIGRGGMGIVYEATQVSLDRRVALKVLPFAAALDGRQLQRFKNEAQAAAHLHHPHIVPVYGVGCERGVHYYAMQFIEGRTLAHLVRELRQEAGLSGGDTCTTNSELPCGGFELVGSEPGPTAACEVQPAAPATRSAETVQAAETVRSDPARNDPSYYRRVANWMLQAAEALEHAHQVGVVHRDVKPANLLVDNDGRIWVTDFGLARFQNDAGLTLTGDLLGTLRYMSPEQALAKHGMVDHRTDLYSMGATFYEMLTLQPVFSGTDRRELLKQIAFDEARTPRHVNRSIPRELETIIIKTLEKEPEERYASAQELADDLRRFLDDQPIRARRPTLWDRAAKWSRRHKVAVVSGVAVLMLAVIGLSVSTVAIAREQARTELALQAQAHERDQAEQNFRQAREAVDFFTQVSAEDLARYPEASKVRRKLLTRALEYYLAFVDRHQNDPTTREELLASSIRVSEILEEMGEREAAQVTYLQACEKWGDFGRKLPPLLGGVNRLSLLSNASVQEELKLSPDKVKHVKKLIGQRRSQVQRFHDLKGWNQQEKELVDEVNRLLDPPELRRLGQIELQQLGTRAFLEPRVAEALVLTEVQKRSIGKIRDQAKKSMWPPHFGYRRNQKSRGGPKWKFDDVWKKANEQILALLTMQQKDRWAELRGKPFKGSLHMGHSFIHSYIRKRWRKDDD